MICCCTGVQPCPVEQGEPKIATSCAITLAAHCQYLLADSSFDISKLEPNQFGFPGGSDNSNKETGKR